MTKSKKKATKEIAVVNASSDAIMEEEQEKKAAELTEEEKEKINEAVVIINEKANEMIYKGYIEIGDYILQHFFDGDLNKVSSKNPRKLNSFNALCERADLVLKANALLIAVKVAGQEKYFNENKIDISSLSYTHKSYLTRLGNNNDKVALVKLCKKHNWTSRQLADEVKKIINSGGTEANKIEDKIVREAKTFDSHLNSLIKKVGVSMFNFDSESIKGIIPKDREKTLDELVKLKRKIEKNHIKLNSMLENFNSLFNNLNEIDSDI